MSFDPEPPPIQSHPPPTPFIPAKPAAKPVEMDLSTTDSRTVASLVCLGIGVPMFLLCLIAPLPAAAAGMILAAFAKPSPLRTAALGGNVLLLGLTLLVGAWLIWDILNNPLPY